MSEKNIRRKLKNEKIEEFEFFNKNKSMEFDWTLFTLDMILFEVCVLIIYLCIARSIKERRRKRERFAMNLHYEPLECTSCV